MKRNILIVALAMIVLAAVSPAFAQVDPVAITHADYLIGQAVAHSDTFYTVAGSDTTAVKMNWVQVYAKDAIVHVQLYSLRDGVYALTTPAADSPLDYVPVPAGAAVEFKNLGDVSLVKVTPDSATDIGIYASKSRY